MGSISIFWPLSALHWLQQHRNEFSIRECRYLNFWPLGEKSKVYLSASNLYLQISDLLQETNAAGSINLDESGWYLFGGNMHTSAQHLANIDAAWVWEPELFKNTPVSEQCVVQVWKMINCLNICIPTWKSKNLPQLWLLIYLSWSTRGVNLVEVIHDCQLK